MWLTKKSAGHLLSQPRTRKLSSCADGSWGSPPVRVGRRWAPKKKSLPSYIGSDFFVYLLAILKLTVDTSFKYFLTSGISFLSYTSIDITGSVIQVECFVLHIYPKVLTISSVLYGSCCEYQNTPDITITIAIISVLSFLLTPLFFSFVTCLSQSGPNI